MSLKTQMSQDAGIFLNPGEFAEAVVYTPKNGTAKTIQAVIDRKRLNPAGEDVGRTLVNQSEIFIAYDADVGVSAVNKGGDIVSFPVNLGGTPIDWAVIDILGQDECLWHLLVQK